MASRESSSALERGLTPRIWSAWRRRPAFVALVVLLSVAAAVGSSLRVDRRYAATASYELFHLAGPGIQDELQRRAADIAAYALGSPPRKPIIAAQPGTTLVRVTVEGSRPEGLAYAVNVYTAELFAWELGPGQRSIQKRYRRLLGIVDDPDTDVTRLPAFQRELQALERQKVTDSFYKKARGARQVAGPTPVTDAAIALPVAFLLAAALSLGLDRLSGPFTPAPVR